MTNIEKFLIGIKRPKRICLFSVVAAVLSAIFIGLHFFGICSERWILIIAAVFLWLYGFLLFLYLLVSWAQASDLLKKAYLDLRQYEIIFQEMRLNVTSAKECQKMMDNPQPSVLTYTEWVVAELKHIEEMIKLMKEAVDIIENNHNYITHD